MPELPVAADAYRQLSGHERLRLRVKLAGKRRLRLDPSVAAIGLVLAALSFTSALYRVESPVRDLSTALYFFVIITAVVVYALLTLWLSVLDPARRRRAWEEVFSYVDSVHPALLRETSLTSADASTEGRLARFWKHHTRRVQRS